MTAAWQLDDLVWGSVPAQHLCHILAPEPGHRSGCRGCAHWPSSMVRITGADLLLSAACQHCSKDLRVDLACSQMVHVLLLLLVAAATMLD